MVVIDFPQMISFYHDKAFEYYSRDLQSIVDYFKKHWDVDCDSELFNLANDWSIDEDMRIDREVKA